jgi:DNA-binding CsgD family transcriptional regulator
MGERLVEFLAAGGMALAQIQVGDLETAAAWIDRASAAAADAPTPLKARQLATWRGRVAAAAGDAERTREHLLRAVELAAETGRPAAHCQALAILSIEAGRLGSERQDDALLDLAEDAATRTLAMAVTLPGHAPWRARALAALTHVRSVRPDRGDAAESAREALADIGQSEQLELFLDIRLACARAIMSAGDPTEVAEVRTGLGHLLGAVVDHTMDAPLLERWLATQPQAELVALAGGAEAARQTFRSSPVVAAYFSLENDSVDLSSQERDLLRLMTEAMPDGEIATTLGVSEEQVARQLGEIMARLKAPSRGAATAFALLQRLV